MTVKENFVEFGELIGSDSPKKIADAYEKMTAPDRDCCLNCQYYVGHCDCPYHIEGKLVVVMNTQTGAFRYVKNGKTYEVDWCVNHKRSMITNYKSFTTRCSQTALGTGKLYLVKSIK